MTAILANQFLGVPLPMALLIAVLGIAMLGYSAARNRAMATAGGDARKLHSLPKYYGLTAGMFAAVPALGVMVIWLLVQPMVVQTAVLPMIPASEIDSAGTQSLSCLMSPAWQVGWTQRCKRVCWMTQLLLPSRMIQAVCAKRLGALALPWDQM